MPREGSPRATATRPCIRQRSDRRAGSSALSLFGRAPKRLARLTDVVLEEPRLRQGAADLELVVAPQRRFFQRAVQQS